MIITLEQIIGIGVFIHGVCVCNKFDKHTHNMDLAAACLRGTAGIAIALKLYYGAAILFGIAEIIVGMKAAAKEI